MVHSHAGLKADDAAVQHNQPPAPAAHLLRQLAAQLQHQWLLGAQEGGALRRAGERRRT